MHWGPTFDNITILRINRHFLYYLQYENDVSIVSQYQTILYPKNQVESFEIKLRLVFLKCQRLHWYMLNEESKYK